MFMVSLMIRFLKFAILVSAVKLLKWILCFVATIYCAKDDVLWTFFIVFMCSSLQPLIRLLVWSV